MTIIMIIMAALVALVVLESYKLGLEEGKAQGFDEAVNMFEEETEKWEKNLSGIH